MTKTSEPKVSSKEPPLLLLFSVRKKIRDILTVGLVQCDFRIIQTLTPYSAAVKADQYTPDLVIADITEKNPRDIMLVNRLQASERTRGTCFLAILPGQMKKTLEGIVATKSSVNGFKKSMLSFIEFPFEFTTLLAKIRAILELPDIAPAKRIHERTHAENENVVVGRSLFDMSVKSDEKLRLIGTTLKTQWAFPFTVVKALDITGSENGCCEQLAQCIRSDSSASANLLKVANTVFYAKRDGKVTDVKEAIVRLGFGKTRNLLAAFNLIDLSSNTSTKSGFTRHEFWLHSLSVALITEKLCADRGYKRPELAFLAGLVHDLGKIPLDNNFSDVFPRLLDETTEAVSAFFVTERRLMNFTHAELGHYLTTLWNFPPPIPTAIMNHHSPEQIEQTTGVAERMLQEAVFIANQVAKAMKMGHSCDETFHEIPVKMLLDFRIGPGGLPKDFFSAINKKLHVFAEYLNIPMSGKNLDVVHTPGQKQTILFVHGTHGPYHPIVTALNRGGFEVKVDRQWDPATYSDISAVISMPEPGRPLDIVLYDDDDSEDVLVTEKKAILKIFIVDVNTQHTFDQDFTSSDTLFINENQLDLRLLMHILDRFFEGTAISLTKTAG